MENQAKDEKLQLMELIKDNPPSRFIDHPLVSGRFKELYKVIHCIKNDAVAEAFYTAEKFHFLKLINDNKNLQECTRLSLYGVFMDVAVSGLSFDPGMKHLHIVPYNVNVGSKTAPKWEKRASLQVSGYGELLLRQLQGQIKYADNPVLVYEGDHFRFGNKNGATILEHLSTIPRTSDNIIACYIRLVRPDGSADYKVFAMEDVQRLRQFSKDKESTAWTSGLPGMVIAKTIKHAFKNYPKLRLGSHSQLASNTVDSIADVSYPLEYGIPSLDDPSLRPGAFEPEMTDPAPILVSQHPSTPSQGDPINDFMNGADTPVQQSDPTISAPAELDF
jgi:recombinational DNA repair protein RecT